MKKNEIYAFAKPFIILNIILSTIVVLILLFFDYRYSLGYLLGAITSYITFIIHAYSINNLGEDNKAFIKSFGNAMFRFLISGLALLLAFFFNLFNIISTFAGLVVIKFLMIIYAFIYHKKTQKEAK